MKVFFTLLFVWLLGSTALWGQACRCGMEQSEPEFIRLHALRRRRYRYECVGRG